MFDFGILRLWVIYTRDNFITVLFLESFIASVAAVAYSHYVNTLITRLVCVINLVGHTGIYGQLAMVKSFSGW